MFTIPKGKSFWEAFTEEVEDFRERTKSLSADEKVTLIEEPSKYFVMCPIYLKQFLTWKGADENFICKFSIN